MLHAADSFPSFIGFLRSAIPSLYPLAPSDVMDGHLLSLVGGHDILCVSLMDEYVMLPFCLE